MCVRWPARCRLFSSGATAAEQRLSRQPFPRSADCDSGRRSTKKSARANTTVVTAATTSKSRVNELGIALDVNVAQRLGRPAPFQKPDGDRTRTRTTRARACLSQSSVESSLSLSLYSTYIIECCQNVCSSEMWARQRVAHARAQIACAPPRMPACAVPCRAHPSSWCV
jgi:hypothetical protein